MKTFSQVTELGVNKQCTWDANAHAKTSPQWLLYGVLVPADGHAPLTAFVLGAGQEICNFDFGTGFPVFEQPLHMSHDFVDTFVALSRPPMGCGDRNLEHRDQDGSTKVATNSEQVEEWVVVYPWSVVFVVVNRHVQVNRPEVNFYGVHGAGK